MMGFGILVWIVIIGGVIFLMMKRGGGVGGGGCCGGHNHSGHDHGNNGGHDQNVPMGHAHGGMDHHTGHREQVTDVKDPVCGMSVKDNSISSAYEGQSYSFCSEHCREKFGVNPADFIK